MLNKKTPKDFAEYRLGKAMKCLRSAERAIAEDDLDNAANRSYYSIFNSMKAVFALDMFESKSHDVIISKFREKYIKTGIFPVSFSNIIGDASETRNECDYDDFHEASDEVVVAQVNNAREFFDAIKEYITQRIPIDGCKDIGG